MCFVRQPVVGVSLGYPRVTDQQQVLPVRLGLGGPVERPGKDGMAIDHHYLAVGNGVFIVEPDGNAGNRTCFRLRVFVVPVAVSVQDQLDADPANMGGNQRIGDWLRGKPIAVYQNGLPRLIDRTNNEVGATAARGVRHLPCRPGRKHGNRSGADPSGERRNSDGSG